MPGYERVLTLGADTDYPPESCREVFMLGNITRATLGAINALEKNSRRADKALQELSTGSRLNTAADAPAGMVMADALKSQIAGTQRALQNSEETVNMLSVADGALASIAGPLNRARELALASANNGITSKSQIEANQIAMNGILSSIQKIAETTAYAGKNLLNGSGGGTLQLTNSANGANGDSYELPSVGLEKLGRISAADLAEKIAGGKLSASAATEIDATPADTGAAAIATEDLDAASGGALLASNKTGEFGVGKLGGKFPALELGAPAPDAYTLADLFSGGKAALNVNPEAAIAVVEQAITEVAHSRAAIGAQQDGLYSNINVLSVTLENVMKIESQLTDTDFAQAMTEYTTAQILSQATTRGIHSLNQHAGDYLALIGA
ncbi:MAG: flagellin [Planctomycetota bacterium]|jgi:flagellin|nr:flagellin [Planctomycetota bacterium]